MFVLQSSSIRLIAIVFAVISCCSCQARADEIAFARDIRPILSDNCFLCHGPAEESRQGGLRLDRRSDAIGDRGGYAAVVAGDAAASELVRRISSSDEGQRMPPPDSGKSLTADQIDLLRRWVDAGADWSDHWAFVAPVRPPIPRGAPAKWSANPIDAFVFRKLEQAGFTPSAPASRATLLRRLYLDLIGLPPTLAEREAFLADNSTDALPRLIERLLASPHYGERWGRHWLDAARYSDSDGYEKDLRRDNWFYRDWVVNALNDDKPYDLFVIEQIAGDLLPTAGQDERVATGFLRNSMVNEEGGADPEQFRVEALFDRMDAIGKAVLGLTIQCAQCHAHKYDPLSHHDYFGMLAYLNNCNEEIAAVYTSDQQAAIDRMTAEIEQIEQELRDRTPNWRDELRKWADSERGRSTPWRVLALERLNWTGQKFESLDDGSIISRSYAPPKEQNDFFVENPAGTIRAVRLELMTHPDLPRHGPGRSIYGTNSLSEFEVAYVAADGSEHKLAIASATANVRVARRPVDPHFVDGATGEEKRTEGPIEDAIDGNQLTAWTTQTDPATRNQPREAVFTLTEPFDASKAKRLIVKLHQNHGGQLGNQRNSNLAGRFRVSVTDERNATADNLSTVVRRIVSRETAAWTACDWQTAFSYWRTTRPEWAAANARIDALHAEYPEGTNQYVVSERTPRVTHRMDRGDFLSPAEVVEPHTPSFLQHGLIDSPRGRLGFAEWLVDRDSPTTARALVNRVWQAYFGTGLVATAEDLGMQSPPPSHPELLDWLAVEFMDSGWSLKHLHRLITTSATYQQASEFRSPEAEADPYNRLLWRGPRARVHAEVVRDVALAASGLLDHRLGGPSVYPPIPRFLVVPPASYGEKPWDAVEANSFRRSIYVQTYRSVPYPPLQVFDAPTGASSCVRRTQSNTPLQALTVLNEQQFVACARALARRLLDAGDAADAELVRRAYHLVLARDPAADETSSVLEFLNRCRSRLANGELDALSIAGSPRGAGSETAREFAAWTLTARCLLNLDETITKQ